MFMLKQTTNNVAMHLSLTISSRDKFVDLLLEVLLLNK